MNNATGPTDATDSLLFGGGTMLRGSADGGIPAGTSDSLSLGGLFAGETRLLSQLDVSLVGRDLVLVSVSETNSTRRLAFVPETTRNTPSDVLLTVIQTVSVAGLDENLTIYNNSQLPISVSLRVAFSADFEDQFTLRSDGRTFDRSDVSTAMTSEPGGLKLIYQRRRGELHFSAGLRVHGSHGPVIATPDPNETAGVLTWDIDLPPQGNQSVHVTFHAVEHASAFEPLARVDGPLPSALRTQSLDDIESLRMPCPTAPEFTVLAAGVPWFLTLFGRDSLIAALLVEPTLPGVLNDVLRALASTQAHESSDRRVAEPGKIVHELRVSELAALDQIPYGRYYGSVDSTPLFLMALATCADEALVVELESAARAAVEWMLDSGGIREHGFLKYRADPDGLLHQGWKDSHDAIVHSDGRIASGAIALCEVQGYAWRALNDMAKISRRVWRDEAWADELERTAAELRRRFRDEFWMPDADFPALALDGAGERVNVVASNAGHLLFCGMLDREDAARVSSRLLEADMFSGWGIRTLSSRAAAYHPLSYHNGSVWPHDTIVTALGMDSYGFSSDARHLAEAVADAAAHFGWRLPELFGGFDRGKLSEPIGYPHAARPQAWAAAAGVAASRLLDGGRPSVPVDQS